VPVQEHERAVLETLLVFVLAPAANVPLLVELLQAVAATEPGPEARESILLLFASLKRLDKAAAAVEEEQKASLAELCFAAERQLLLLARTAAGLRARQSALTRAPALCEELRATFAAVVPRSENELAQFREQQRAGEAERSALEEVAEREAQAQGARIAELAAREQELRRLLARATQERLDAVEEAAGRRRETQARVQELGRRLAVLEANVCALEMDVEAAEKVLAALAAVTRQVPFAALAREAGERPTDLAAAAARLERLQSQVLQRLQSEPDCEAARVAEAADRCATMVAQLRSMGREGYDELVRGQEQIAALLRK
jgi:hypothetical protein